MSYACAPILVGVTFSVSEILLPSKTAKFPFRTIIVHGGQKIESPQKIHAYRGWCEMHGNQFLWAWLLRFRRYCLFLFAFKTAKFPFRTMDYSPWSSKNLIDWNRTKKFMQIRIDELCMCTNFGGCDLFGFGDTATFKNGQISLSDHYSPWGSKNTIASKNSCI